VEASPSGNDVVTTMMGVGRTEIVKSRAADSAPIVSVSWKGNTPISVGSPISSEQQCPSGPITRPGGSAPAETVQADGGPVTFMKNS
jgi:hypothetical protein